MPQNSSPILRLFGLHSFTSKQQSSPSLQTKVVVCKLPMGKDSWLMLSHRLCPGALRDAAGGPLPKAWQRLCQQFGNVDS